MTAEAQAAASPPDTAGIQLALPFFEGPLDLLLHLIEREELDITNVALVAVADQYMEILHQSEQINLDALAEFISIGARLLLLKSRALLPRPRVDDGEPEEDDLGDELTRQLLEYKLFKEAAGQLRAIETAGLHSYPRIAPPPELPPPPGLDGVTVDLLRQMVEIALTREVEHHEPVHVIRPHKITVSEKVELLRARLEAEGSVSFRSVIDACHSRMEIIVSFMAVLELIKSRVLDAVQDGTFTDILLVPSGEEALEVGDTSEFDAQA
jgi:segregation and condensation protein A